MIHLPGMWMFESCLRFVPRTYPYNEIVLSDFDLSRITSGLVRSSIRSHKMWAWPDCQSRGRNFITEMNRPRL